MNKNLHFRLEEAASFFHDTECTENEMYLLDILLDLCREYNDLVEDYNSLVLVNSQLKNIRKLKVNKLG